MASVIFSGKVTKWRGPVLANSSATARRYDYVVMEDIELLYGGAAGTPQARPEVLVPIDLRYELLATNLQSFGAAQRGVVTTDNYGAFSFELKIADLNALGNGVWYRLKLEAYLPDGFASPVLIQEVVALSNVPSGTPGANNQERLANFWQSRVSRLEVPVNTQGLSAFAFSIVPPPNGGGGAFQGTTDAVVEFFDDNNNQLGVAPLSGDDNQRSANVYLISDLISGHMWFRIRTGSKLVASAPPSPLEALCRSQVHVEDGNPPSHTAAVVRIDRLVGIGTLSNQVPESGVATSTMVYQNLDLDFTKIDGREDHVLRVQADVGLGGATSDGSIFMAFELGSFEAFYSLSTANLSAAPFVPGELSSAVVIASVQSSFDAQPGNNVDELVEGGENAVEAAIASRIDSSVLPLIRTNIAKELNKELNNVGTQLKQALPLFPDAVEAMMTTVFVQLNSLKTNKDAITLVARGGLWSAELDLMSAGTQCPVGALGLRQARLNILPSGRAYQKLLMQEELAPWREEFEKHKPELLQIVLKNPKLATQVAGLLRDCHPALINNTGPLDAKLAARIQDTAEKVKKVASAEVGAVVSVLADVARKARTEGRIREHAVRAAMRLKETGQPRKKQS